MLYVNALRIVRYQFGTLRAAYRNVQVLFYVLCGKALPVVRYEFGIKYVLHFYLFSGTVVCVVW